MQNSSKLAEPSENVINEISYNLILAVAEANGGNSWLRCKSLANPNLSDGVQLAEQIRALHLAQVVIKRGLDRRIADARRHQNALQPVNKLPAEVLSAIFHQFLSDVPIFHHFNFLFIVARVSAHWKSVVDSTPSLWSVVSSNHSRVQVDWALQKSGRTPISVACRYTGEALTATVKQGSRDFLRRMQSTGRQWDQLTLRLPTIGHLREFLEEPAPYLRKLNIKVANPSSDPVDLCGDVRGVLEDVSLTGASIEWDSEALSGLQRLNLDYRLSGLGPSLTEILCLLQQSPTLRRFSWSGWISLDTVTTGVTPTITLSHLTRLSLRDAPEVGVFKILECIHAPACSHLTIQCDLEDGDTTQSLSQLERFLPSLEKSLQRVATISICLGPSSFHYHCVPETPDCPSKLDFEFGDTDPFPLLEWFAEHLHDFSLMTPPIKIRFDPRFDFTRHDTILPALFRLRNVVSLTVADRVVGPCRPLKWLSTPIRSQGNTLSWPFPNLWELELGQSNLLIRDVLNFFGTRYPKTLPKDMRGRPVWLQTLRLVGDAWQDTWVENDLKRILMGTEYSLKRSRWVHVPCMVNEDPMDIGDKDSSCGSSVSDEGSAVDSETTSETDDSDASESTDSEDETREE
ncbi:hypothetical protein FRC01_004023 [Tulasnella sp. 417]|nr:hypothetical protein FRC01_004023 [Tulasnella sp. 417]